MAADPTAELAARLEQIRTVEAADPAHAPLTGKDIGAFVGAALLLALLGILVMAL